MFSLQGKKIWVAGHKGMVGSAIVRRLQSENCHIVYADRAELDLLRQADVEAWIHREKPDAVFLCAAKVGGIHANTTYPAEFIYQNLQIETNVIHAAYQVGVQKLLFMGSSCIYPRDAVQPITEDALLTGALESTNEWYAVAKIAGLKMCEAYRRQYGCAFISVMPTNLYGSHDNYHLQNAHVPAAFIRRFHEAKIAKSPRVSIWGTGTPLREFMHVDDVADASIFLMRNYDGAPPINVGSGYEISIYDFATMVAKIIGFEGDIACDTSYPDGTPRKRLDITQLTQLGWNARISLEEGLASTYQSYISGL